MNSRLLAGISALLFGTSFSSFAQAEGLNTMPVFQDGFDFEPTLSIIGGPLDIDAEGVDKSGSVGIELAYNSPLLAPPTNSIRQQFSITSFDNDGLEMTSFELNPHYVFDLSPSFGLGFGPGIGILNIDSGNDSDTVFTGQLGASLHFRTGTFYLGLEARQQYVGNVDGVDDADNSRTILKLGHDF